MDAVLRGVGAVTFSFKGLKMQNSRRRDQGFGRSFFPSMFFCGEATKKTSIDGLKWRDLVMGR